MPTIDELRNVRIEKLEALRKKGVNPYPSSVQRDHTISEAIQSTGKIVAVTGRVVALRGHGKIVFADIVDGTGKIQAVLKADELQKSLVDLIEYIDIGDFIAVQGKVGKTQAGEISVFAHAFQLITKSIRPLPDKWYGLKDVEERYRQRYLDMIINPEVRDRLIKRSRIIEAIRSFLNGKEYLEVETPTLQPVYGGGFARPFSTHHNELNADLYLRISDEMYLKRLIVGGLEKVYEITKVFRNEGIDHDHNPEFTMFEAQIAFEDYTYGMDIIEEIIEYSAKKTLGVTDFVYQGKKMSVKRPWVRYRLVESIEKFTGVDPLKWKSTDEAKRAIMALDIPEAKLASLHKIKTVGEMIAFTFEETVEEKLIQPTIIFDYPIEVSPLAKKCDDPRFTQRFEMFAFGSELGNNYSELNDPLDLRKRFVEEKKREKAGFAEAHQTDYDYLEAIEHGFPPTCGIAIGIDRLVMLLTDAKSIKEVIAFPTLRPDEASKKAAPAQKVDNKKEVVTSSDTLSKEKALAFLHAHMQNTNLRRHCYAVGAVMRTLAHKLGGDADLWEVMGILHDADWEETKENPDQHTIHTLAWLEGLGITKGPLVHAFQSHNTRLTHLAELDGLMEWALETCDELTGFIVAVALVRPDKKLATVTLDSITRKWKVKEFAKGVIREQVAQCEEKLGIPLLEFMTIALTAMQEIHEDLGL